MRNKEWLDTPPPVADVKTKNGGKFIPYKIIKVKLDHLCDHDWGTHNFKETYITLPNRKVLVSGNIDVDVTYEYDGRILKRRLAGAANFILHKGSNPHPTPTVKSLAIMNAVKPLGKQFGWGLNPDNEDEETEFLPVFMVEKDDTTVEEKRMKTLIEQSTDKRELASYKLVIPASLKPLFNQKLKELSK